MAGVSKTLRTSKTNNPPPRKAQPPALNVLGVVETQSHPPRQAQPPAVPDENLLRLVAAGVHVVATALNPLVVAVPLAPTVPLVLIISFALAIPLVVNRRVAGEVAVGESLHHGHENEGWVFLDLLQSRRRARIRELLHQSLRDTNDRDVVDGFVSLQVSAQQGQRTHQMLVGVQ